MLCRSDFDQFMIQNYVPLDVIPVKGKGSRLWDQNGKEYIDFAGGIAVSALGHCHDEVVEVLKEQGEKLWHVSNVYTNEPALALAKQITQSTFAERVFFCNSGAEANEAALKLARKYAWDNFGQQKHEIIGLNNSFHGRTLFTVSVGGQAKYRTGFEPVVPGVSHVDFQDIKALEKKINERTCAVIIECVQGEGGVHAATAEYLQQVRALCDQHQALLIIDEIQTGVGRTGKLFSYMHAGIEPDILTSAKALGNGMPIGAMLSKDHVSKSLTAGSHGTTFGGNPLACAVASKVYDIINQPDFLNAVEQKSAFIKKRLEEINQEVDLFTDIRGQGLLIGCELKAQYTGLGRRIMGFSAEEGLMHLQAGPSVIRFTPALNISDEDIEEGLNRFKAALLRFKTEG